jgi:Na+-transporting NADH:ubiquinone oxidoreductase subunit NqrB
LLPDLSTPPPEADEQSAWARPVPVRLGEVVLALTLLGVGAFIAWQAALLSFGRVGLPGPGFFPFALGIGLAAIAFALLFILGKGGGDGGAVFLGHRNVLVTMVALGGAAFAFERLGALVTLGTFAALMLLLVARTAAWRAVLGAAIGMVAVWLFFGIALGVRLPDGTVWEQLTDALSAASPSDQP